MKKLAVIPSRYASTRFPGKPLIDLLGKSMIQRVMEGVVNSGLFDEVVVATDDERIYKHIQEINGKVLMTSSKHKTGTDRCGEVLKHYFDYDIVANIQGDEPLLSSEQLETLLSSFNDPSVEIATLGIVEKNNDNRINPNRIKIVTNYKSDAVYFSRSAIPFERNKNDYPFLRHIGLYGFRASTLKKLIQLKPTLLEQTEGLEQLRWMYYGYAIHIAQTKIETPNIDTPDDVEAVITQLKNGN